MSLAEIVDVRDFGAVGDGITDDTQAIQSALNSLKNYGGTVSIPLGTFKITSPLMISRHTSLKGLSARETIIHYYGKNSAVYFRYNHSYISLETLTIERKGDKAETIGVLMESNQFCTLRDTRVLDFETGYRIDGKDRWCATNIFYNLLSLRCTYGIIISANEGKQSNHNIFMGGYIVGQIPQVSRSKGIVIERGDSNRFYGTAVEDYDIGYHFKAVDAGGNSAISPRAENCKTATYLLDSYTVNTSLVDPFGIEGIINHSRSNLILTSSPHFNAKNISWDNRDWLKFRDSGGGLKEVIGVNEDNNVVYRTPSFFPVNNHSFEVADIDNIYKKELVIGNEEVKVRRYLKHGVTSFLPIADVTQRRREIFVEGGENDTDKLCICVKKEDGSYGWFDKISGSFLLN